MKMNEDQKKLAEDNIKLVYYFLYNHCLSIDEFSDILMIELCKAAMYYDPELGPGSFSTFAYKCFINRIRNEFKSRKTTSNIINYLPIASLDNDVFSENDEDDEREEEDESESADSFVKIEFRKAQKQLKDSFKDLFK